MIRGANIDNTCYQYPALTIWTYDWPTP